MEKSKEIQLYVISHNPKDIVNIKTNEIYTPLFVGRNGKDNLGFLSDDTGENISAKNQDYSELTGLYWMWKNSNATIMGLCHYRRYFNNDNGSLIQKKDIIDYLSDNDIILPKKTKLIKGTYKETYKDHYITEILNVAEDVISDIYPEYIESYKEIMSQDEFYSFNMFIAKKELINEYCNWLFTILEEIENRVDLSKYPRVLGYISEAIQAVWLNKQDLKIKELKIRYIGNKLKVIMAITENQFLRKTYRLLYSKFLNKPAGKKIEEKINEFFYGK